MSFGRFKNPGVSLLKVVYLRGEVYLGEKVYLREEVYPRRKVPWAICLPILLCICPPSTLLVGVHSPYIPTLYTPVLTVMPYEHPSEQSVLHF